MKKILLICGILSSLYYVAINIFVSIFFEGYNMTTQTVSELSAIGAPTRTLWLTLAVVYVLLFAAFGWGIWKSAAENRPLRVVGGLILANSVFEIYWPPMHLRETLAAGGGTISDTLHIVWAMITLAFMMAIMGFGAAALGKQFRNYTAVTFAVFIVFGVLIGTEAPNINVNGPTPYIGIWERVNIASFMLWVAMLAVALLQRENMQVPLKSS